MAAGKEQIECSNRGLLIRAPAKINLTLMVAGQRPDGFHEIETIMAKLDWFDELLFERGTEKGIELVCTGPHWAPEGEANLVHTACRLLFEKFGRNADVKVTLTKNIPAGSGLGSASSDAAAAVIGLSRYLGLSIDTRDLAELAPQLGSDVAFFFGGPMAVCTGKGEKVEAIDTHFDFSALLVVPDISVSTKRIYENYHHDPDLYERLRTQINAHIDKNRIDLACQMCANMLEKDCFDLYGELVTLKHKVESITGRSWCLSGSGSAFFSVFKNDDTQQIKALIRELDEIPGCTGLMVRRNCW
jgi:4-diphosphocytidyl-2-C-methyl-D-erythritol kinase